MASPPLPPRSRCHRPQSPFVWTPWSAWSVLALAVVAVVAVFAVVAAVAFVAVVAAAAVLAVWPVAARAQVVVSSPTQVFALLVIVVE